MQKDSNQPVLAALEYAKQGWPVLPLYSNMGGNCTCGNPKCTSPGKHPRTKNGCKEATKDLSQVLTWWQKWPDANIGIATGSTAGLVVVDIDPRHGGDESWQAFSASNNLPETRQVKSGGDGVHLYYQMPADIARNKANLLPGVDIRGEGGYIVAPPSVHVSGRNYQWANDLPIAELPIPLLELIHGKSTTSAKKSDSCIRSGSRNSTLFSLGGLLRRHGLEPQGIQSALSAVNTSICEQPLTDSELSTIAQSVTRYEPLRVVDAEPEWSDPQPLPNSKVTVPRMTADYLPEALRGWAEDICDRMQIPLEFIAAPAIVSLSSVVGRKLGIYPKRKDDWLVIPNLWGGVIARPGFFKSPAIAEALQPLEALIKDERSKYEAALIVAKAKEDIIKAKIEGIKDNVKKAVRKGNTQDLDGLELQLAESVKELEDLHVTEKRYKTNDATIEKIGALLVDNPDGILIARDELAGWLRSLDKTGREGDREFYLESWNGYGSHTVDRIGRGTLHIPSLCLPIFGGLQPGKLEAYIGQGLTSGAGDDGLLQRFQLLMYPEMLKNWKNVDRRPHEQAKEQVFDLFKKVAALPATEPGKKPHGVHFSREAQAVFDNWRIKFEERLRQKEAESPAFESHLAKYRSLVPSLALIFEVGIAPEIDQISSASLRLALKWANFLETHARKIYASIIQSESSSALALSKKIQSSDLKDKATVRYVYRKCWSGLDSTKRVNEALCFLEDIGWVRVENESTSTKPREIIRINPKLKAFLASQSNPTKGA